MNQKLKYRFEVTYQTKNAKQVSGFLKKCDLNVGDICFKEVFAFNYTADEKPISYFKDLITQAYESQDCIVLKIVGGKVE